MRLRDFHYLRRADRRVIFFLLAVFIVVSLALLVFHGKEDMYTSRDSGDSAMVGRGNGRDGHYYKYGRGGGNRYYAVPGRAVSRFPFDPNTADSTELLALGLEPWQVRNIYKYRAKGGVFRKKEDFARIYGLTNKQYRELAPLIRIGSDYQPYTSRSYQNVPYGEAPDSVPGRRFPAKLKLGERIELNEADTASLMKVPGIGTYFARQIVIANCWVVTIRAISSLRYRTCLRKPWLISRSTLARCVGSTSTSSRWANSSGILTSTITRPRTSWTIVACMARYMT